MSKEKVPYLAPGCFGSPVVFKADMVCGACPFRSECEPVHLLALEETRKRLGIKVPETRRRAKPVAEPITDDPERLTLPVKVQKLLARLDKENLDIVGKMKRGVNPFAETPTMKYMQIACHLIMKLDVPVTQKLISVGLTKSMSWAEGTSDAHARMAVQALTHVGAIQNVDGVLSVRN